MKYSSRFEVVSIKRAGQKGTKRLLSKYGENLRNVRYLRDKLTGDRFKTVEIVVESGPYSDAHIDPETLVGIKVGMHEKELRAKIKALGGSWDHYDRVWLINFKYLKTLGVDNREFSIREDPPDVSYSIQ